MKLPFARPVYQEIPVYAPQRDWCAIDLSDNTNLYGIPPAARKSMAAPDEAWVTRYPALYVPELKQALAEYVGAKPEQLVTGCGSDDVLDSAIRAFGEPGDKVAYCDPSFAMIPLFAQMNGLVPAPVPLTKDFDADADGLLATGARIIYLCSPNNPTGTLVSQKALARILKEAKGIVIVDQAYAEFAPPETLAKGGGNLLEVRTLSKAFGLAGLRIGYAIGDPAVVADVEKSRGPYKVNAIAERAALAAVREDLPWVKEKVADVLKAKDRFVKALQADGYRPLPSHANFVLVPVRDAAGAAKKMRASGVAVRPFPSLRDIGDALRISVGPWEVMETALARFREAVS